MESTKSSTESKSDANEHEPENMQRIRNNNSVNNDIEDLDEKIPNHNAFYSTEEEVARKQKLYANIISTVEQKENRESRRMRWWARWNAKSNAVSALSNKNNTANCMNDSNNNENMQKQHVNLIEQVYNEDFKTIDHNQAIRFPQAVHRQIKDAIRAEAERRCAEMEKTMARCMQDKMWTTWKCQKHRDAYYYCVMDEEKKNNTSHFDDNSNFVDLLTAYRWKYNLGVFHGEITGRNNLMRKIWSDHYPDRELPHPWVRDEYK